MCEFCSSNLIFAFIKVGWLLSIFSFENKFQCRGILEMRFSFEKIYSHSFKEKKKEYLHETKVDGIDNLYV